FGPRNLGVPADDIPERVREALEAVGLDRPGIADADPFSRTKWDRQRVAVASVLAIRPAILIFDEPTTGLDYREIRGMMALIHRLNQAGHTIVMITHLMWVAAEYAARCVVMQAGRIVADDRTRTVFAQPERLGQLGLRVPQIPRFTQHYGRTLPAESVAAVGAPAVAVPVLPHPLAAVRLGPACQDRGLQPGDGPPSGRDGDRRGDRPVHDAGRGFHRRLAAPGIAGADGLCVLARLSLGAGVPGYGACHRPGAAGARPGPAGGQRRDPGGALRAAHDPLDDARDPPDP